MPGVILLSGGLDSTVAMAKFLGNTSVGLALTFDYGQRAAEKEKAAAKSLAQHFGISHRTIELPFLANITETSLVNTAEKVPEVKLEDLDKVLEVTGETALQVWVPNRNGLFINIAAAFAESLDYSFVVAGFNAEEAVTFPDNSQEFVQAANQTLGYSTLNRVRLISPTQNLTKLEIVKMGMELGIPWDKIWSCYHANVNMCGKCESCQRLKRALSGQHKVMKKLFS